MLESVELTDIHYNIGQLRLLKGVNLQLQPKGIIGLLGPNGAGKTLTNRIISLLLQPTSGTIKWDDKILPIGDAKLIRKYILKIGYMGQKPYLFRNTVSENLRVPLMIRDIPSKQQEQLVMEMLDKADAVNLADRPAQKLSYGQQQKIALLRTLIYEPEVVILDEPTASMDLANTKWFEEQILQYQHKTNCLMLMTTHDPFQAKRVTQKVNILIDGEVMEHGNTNEIMQQPNNNRVKDYLEGKL